VDDRELILAGITDHFPTSPPTPSASLRAGEGDLWELFFANLAALGGAQVTPAELEALTAKSRYVDADAGRILGIGSSAENVWEAEVGFSLALGAIAQTGTLIVSAGPEGSRLSSLAPPINVMLVERSSIVPTLDLAIARFSERTTVLITGPSRTADIEGVLVRGVHGPGELLVYVIEK
jgi:hypothetical protein